MSDSDITNVQKLLRLKRHERPPEGYYEDFLLEFQHRQRAEMLRRSAFSLWTEKVANWFWGFGSSKWVIGAATAYASLMIFAYLNNDPVDPLHAGEGSGAASSSAEQVGLSASQAASTDAVRPMKRTPEKDRDRERGFSIPGFREL